MPKNAQNHTIAFISHATKVMLKILQGRLQEYVNRELPDVQVEFRKVRGTRDQIANIQWIIKKQESSRKTSALLTLPKPLTPWLWKILQETTWPASWETCMQVKKQQLELDREQQTGSKSGKEYVKPVYCHPAYLTSMQSISCEMPGLMKHKLESRLLGEISITSDMQMTQPLCRKWRGTEEPLDESERGEWKYWLKTQQRSWQLVPSLHGK